MVPLPPGTVDVICCGYAASVHSKRLVTKAITSCAHLPINFLTLALDCHPPLPIVISFPLAALQAVTLLERCTWTAQQFTCYTVRVYFILVLITPSILRSEQLFPLFGKISLLFWRS